MQIVKCEIVSQKLAGSKNKNPINIERPRPAGRSGGCTKKKDQNYIFKNYKYFILKSSHFDAHISTKL